MLADFFREAMKSRLVKTSFDVWYALAFCISTFRVPCVNEPVWLQSSPVVDSFLETSVEIPILCEEKLPKLFLRTYATFFDDITV